MGNKALDYTALTIALIGAVNWGLVGFFNFNLVCVVCTRLHFTHIQAERHKKNKAGPGSPVFFFGMFLIKPE